MDRYLVTHSLLSSWLYAIRENPYEDATTERDPMKEFMTTLRRESTEPTDAMLKGIAFEDLVTSIVDGRGDTRNRWYEAASEVADIVRGGVLQYSAKRQAVVNGIPVLLHGRLDGLKAGTIYDIKYSEGYEAGKYIDSSQHPMYFALVPEARRFTYLVSNGTYVWPETYRREESADILELVGQFFAWLDAFGLTETYRYHWKAL